MRYIISFLPEYLNYHCNSNSVLKLIQMILVIYALYAGWCLVIWDMFIHIPSVNSNSFTSMLISIFNANFNVTLFRHYLSNHFKTNKTFFISFRIFRLMKVTEQLLKLSSYLTGKKTLKLTICKIWVWYGLREITFSNMPLPFV